MQSTLASLNAEVEDEICSIASSNETADNLPGPGRLLGNFYVSAGQRLEKGLGKVAGRIGYEPIPANNQRTREDESFYPRIRHDEGTTVFDNEVDAYECCSIASSNETADDLPGPGRLLGNLYVSTGKRFENGLGMVAVRMGHGPHVLALKIQKILDNKRPPSRNFNRRKKLRKTCQSLARYIR